MTRLPLLAVLVTGSAHTCETRSVDTIVINADLLFFMTAPFLCVASGDE